MHDAERDPHLPAELTAPVANPRKAADWLDYCEAWKKADTPASDAHLTIGSIFQDAPFAGEMVVIPPGTYLQGDEAKPVEGVNSRAVTIGYPLAVGRFPVTFEEWDFAQDDLLWSELSSRPPHRPKARAWGRVRRPVISVSWRDAQAYAKWLSARTGKTYRLLSEAEWEYACRAGTETAYNFGDSITKTQAQFSENGSAKQTVEVGSFPANPFGLHDMHGNVWEWCEDAWRDDYNGAPVDGTARTSSDSSVHRILRGGSWISNPLSLRSANRLRSKPGFATTATASVWRGRSPLHEVPSAPEISLNPMGGRRSRDSRSQRIMRLCAFVHDSRPTDVAERRRS